jgi:SHS2 domain-containing protein
VDHPAELILRICGSTLAELLVAAGEALAETMVGGRPVAPPGPEREIVLTAPDAAALLVDWLNELVFLAETERWVARTFEVADASETTLRIRARGVTVESAPALVKAATLHNLALERGPDGYRADVVLDV